MFRSKYLKSNNYHDPTSKQYKMLRSKYFFPGFSNGWHAICNAEDITNNKIKSVNALGISFLFFHYKYICILYIIYNVYNII